MEISIQGEVQFNSPLEISETGGIYQPISSGDLYKSIYFQSEGGHTMKKNSRYILFFSKFIEPQIEGAYIPLSIYKGKFEISNFKNLVKEVSEESITNFDSSVKFDFKNQIKTISKGRINKNKK